MKISILKIKVQEIRCRIIMISFLIKLIKINKKQTIIIQNNFLIINNKIELLKLNQAYKIYWIIKFSKIFKNQALKINLKILINKHNTQIIKIMIINKILNIIKIYKIKI